MEENYIYYLSDHMTKRGVSIDMLKGLIREVGHMAINSSYISLNMVNERLEYLGWGKDVLDEKGLQLILLVLEKKPPIFIEEIKKEENAKISLKDEYSGSKLQLW